MTRFTTHFGFQSTAAEVIAGVDLTGRKAIVTGGAAGVGAETVRALAGAGAAVTMAVRRVDVAEPVAAELRRSAGNEAIDIHPLRRRRRWRALGNHGRRGRIMRRRGFDLRFHLLGPLSRSGELFLNFLELPLQHFGLFLQQFGLAFEPLDLPSVLRASSGGN
jgi:hypothetical protein